MKKTLFLSAMLAMTVTSAYAITQDTTAHVAVSEGEGVVVGTTETPFQLHLDDNNGGSYTLTLDNGTAISNSEGTANMNANWKQIQSITLDGTGSTATLVVTNNRNYGFLGGGHNQTNLTLNGGTLVKTDVGTFTFAHTAQTTGDTGTIDVQEGGLEILNNVDSGHSNDQGLNAAGLKIQLADNTTMQVHRNSTIGSLVSTGSVQIDSGKILTVNAGAKNTTGSFSLTGGTVSGGGKLFIDNTQENASFSTTLDLTKIAAGTTISLKGVRNGTLKGAAEGVNTVAGNIELANTSNWAAAEWTTIEGSSYKFTGAISGDGNMAFSQNKTMALTFTGDLSGWTAKGADWAGLRANGSAALNVLIEGSPTNTVVGNAITKNNAATINLTVNRNAQFDGNMSLSSMTVKSGKQVSINNNATINNALTLENGAILGIVGSNHSVTVKTLGVNGTTPTIRFADGATLTVNNQGSSNLWLNGQTLTLLNTEAADGSISGGTLVLQNFLSGSGKGSPGIGSVAIAEGVTMRVTGTAVTDNLNAGFMVWNGSNHVYTVDGTLQIDHNMRVERVTNNAGATAANTTFNVGGSGTLSLGEGIDFINAGSESAPLLSSLGTINVNGGTLAIGGDTHERGSRATVNLADGAKVVALGGAGSAVSTGQIFTVADGATVTFDSQTADKLTVTGTLNKADAAVKTVGNVQLGDVTVAQVTADGNSATGALTTDAVVLKNGTTMKFGSTYAVGSVMVEDNASANLFVQDTDSSAETGRLIGVGKDANHTISNVELGAGSSLTFGAADVKVESLTLGSGSLVTVGDEDNHAFDLVTSSVTVQGDAGMNANLVVTDGTLSFAAGAILTMGCDVVIEGSTVYIALDGTTKEELFAELANGQYNLTIIDGLTGSDYVNLAGTSVYIDGEACPELSLRLVEDTAKGGYRIAVAPEPATATLSLLALAGLCARRRRH